MFLASQQLKNIFPVVLFAVLAIVLATVATDSRDFPPVAAQTSPDAIAVRVIPNPEHYSAARWYREQGFTGSPQSLTVDGYEAIRDGRTVYVNAANIDDNGTPDPTDDALYTNIYLISYNQKAEKSTIDIFAQILSHWQFNTNITQPGTCSQTNTTACLKDTDCPLGEYCLSQKAKIIRDTKRLADLAEIKTALEKFKDKYRHYPTLKSGSYLPYKTISVWPSWQKTLAQELGFVPLPIDPVNKLGDCGEDRFNPITCWDEKAKEFADANPNNSTLDLPISSKVYVYTSSLSGDYFYVCGIMETDYITVTEIGDCNTMGADIQVSGSVLNQPPHFTYFDLRGFSNREYKGDIKATDPDGDTLTWTINTNPNSQWASWHNGQPPVLQNISPTEKLLYSPTAGTEGIYQIEITLDDNRGQPNSIVSQMFDIKILNSPPVLDPINCTESIRVNNNYPPCHITATDIDGDDITFEFDGLPVGFDGDVDNGVITGLPPVSAAGSYFIKIRAIDARGGTSRWSGFNLKINTYCGDGEVQAINGEGIKEECDGNQGSCIVDGYNGYKECQPDCTFGPCIPTESCGDGIVNGFEECDDNSINCIISGYQGQKNCQSDCTFGPCIPTESCGDGIVNGPEECDPNLDDVGIMKAALEAISPGITSGASNEKIRVMYQNACTSDCQFGCAADINKLGTGCYINDCQKGKWACADDGVTLVCENVFNTPGNPEYIGQDLYDYCCSGEGDKLVDMDFEKVRLPSLGMCSDDYCTPWGSGCDFSGCADAISCDEVCQNLGKICIGVGLEDVATHYCKYVVHNIGSNPHCGGSDCGYSENLADTNCQNVLFGRTSPTCEETWYDDNGDMQCSLFHVGETVCYCK